MTLPELAIRRPVTTFTIVISMVVLGVVALEHFVTRAHRLSARRAGGVVMAALGVPLVFLAAAGDTAAWLDAARIPYRDLCFIGAKGAIDADLYIDDDVEPCQGSFRLMGPSQKIDITGAE